MLELLMRQRVVDDTPGGIKNTAESRRWETMANASSAATRVMGSAVAAGICKMRMDTPSGTMYGSPWKNAASLIVVANGASFSRVVQHALPNMDVFKDVVANKRWIVAQVVNVGNQSKYDATSRNGYTSMALGAPAVGFTVAWIRYYDPVSDRIMEVSPYTAAAPVVYTGSTT